MQTLWNIKLAVLVKPEHENRISHVGMSSVKTGIANTLGNHSLYLLARDEQQDEAGMIKAG